MKYLDLPSKFGFDRRYSYSTFTKILLMDRVFLVFFLISLIHKNGFSQASDAPQLVKQGIDLIAAKNEEAALEKFKDALKSDPNNYEAAWNASFLCSRIGNR